MDRDKLTVSGLSSGAYFAVQFHVAFSSVIKGAGVIAGGQSIYAIHKTQCVNVYIV